MAHIADSICKLTRSVSFQSVIFIPEAVTQVRVSHLAGLLVIVAMCCCFFCLFVDLIIGHFGEHFLFETQQKKYQTSKQQLFTIIQQQLVYILGE